jgi:pimeloyl-ACP methyl ester carboxylesterase
MRHLVSLIVLAVSCGLSSIAFAQEGLVPPGRMVQIDKDTFLNVRQSGHGPTAIVFVPGWTMSSEVFEHQFQHFANSDRYTFISYDPRSQGYSTKTRFGNEYTQHGRDLNALLKALGINRVILAGWSMGVYDVTAYINQFGTAKVAGLILIDGTPRCAGTDDVSQWVWYRYDDADHAKQSYTFGAMYTREQMDKSFAEWMLDNPTPEAVHWVTRISDQTANDVAAITNEVCSYYNYEADVVNYSKNHPLMIVTRNDVAVAASNWIASNTPSADFHSLGKHLMFWEHYLQFDQFLDAFLAKIR